MVMMVTQGSNTSQEENEVSEAMWTPPPWLKPLLCTNFYKKCPKHPHFPHSACNMFCLNCCTDGAFCCHCLTSLHSGHSVLQIRKSSNENAVRVMEVEKVVDVSGIQTYMINNYKVIYLRRKAQAQAQAQAQWKPPLPGKSASSRRCSACERSLMDGHSLFCSLACKFQGLLRKNWVEPCKNNTTTSATTTREENGSKLQGEGEGEGDEKRIFRKIRIIQARRGSGWPFSNSGKRKAIVPQRAPISGHLEGLLWHSFMH